MRYFDVEIIFKNKENYFHSAKMLNSLRSYKGQKQHGTS